MQLVGGGALWLMGVKIYEQNRDIWEWLYFRFGVRPEAEIRTL
jgi:hypothetical protein